MNLWRHLDDAAHILHVVGLIPPRLLAWIYDRYDLSLGLTVEELKTA